jgi:hypothetical protein
MKTIGSVDRIDLIDLGIMNIEAKIDTGANRSSIHCSNIERHKRNGVDEIAFHIPLDSSHGVNEFHSTDFFKKKIKSSSGHVEERYIIKTAVVLFGQTYRTSFSLTDRSEMKYPILLGKKLLENRFIVDVSQKNLSYKAKVDK